MSKKSIPIGVDNFYKLLDPGNNYLFVDKSLLIQEVIEDKSEVTLITRPRRWGKTVNMSMLQHFFAADAYGRVTQGLFNNLKIAEVEAGRYLMEQGKYPVIFITFASVKQPDFATAFSTMSNLVKNLYNAHYHELMAYPQFTPGEKATIERICMGDADRSTLESSLERLSYFFYQMYQTPVYILIDEYDTPIHEAYNQGYYDEMLGFMRNLLLTALKGNPYLKKAVMTGILRVSKESMLSGLSHLDVHTLFSPKYKQFFGFTEEEVGQVFKEANLTYPADSIRKYYNGYQIDGQIIYNPWSIMKCINSDGLLGTYWVNTGDDAMLYRLMLDAPASVKQKFECLMKGETISVITSEAIRFQDFDRSEMALWSLLLAAGYLTPRHYEFYKTEYRCALDIPNEEVRSLYQMVFFKWLEEHIGDNKYEKFLQDLVQGRLELFVEKLNEYLLRYTSYHDFPDESNYHTFMLGLLIAITDQYQLYSNIESGKGRLDITLIPKVGKVQGSAKDCALLIEIKRAKEKDKQRELAQKAFDQINQQRYQIALEQNPELRRVLKVGAAFHQRTVLLCQRMDDIVMNQPLIELEWVEVAEEE